MCPLCNSRIIIFSRHFVRELVNQVTTVTQDSQAEDEKGRKKSPFIVSQLATFFSKSVKDTELFCF